MFYTCHWFYLCYFTEKCNWNAGNKIHKKIWCLWVCWHLLFMRMCVSCASYIALKISHLLPFIEYIKVTFSSLIFFFFNLTLFWQPTKTPIMCFLQHALLYSKLCDYTNILKSVTQNIILLITMRTILTINVFMLHIWDVRLYH